MPLSSLLTGKKNCCNLQLFPNCKSNESFNIDAKIVLISVVNEGELTVREAFQNTRGQLLMQKLTTYFCKNHKTFMHTR